MQTYTFVLVYMYYIPQPERLCGPRLGVSQQEATRLVALLAAEKPALSTYPAAWLPKLSGVLIYGLERLMR